ncbi:hypothetical protein [Belnapia sp. F-4-1]|nr:hypothetical protein [Belnapia sp. F-4-1]
MALDSRAAAAPNGADGTDFGAVLRQGMERRTGVVALLNIKRD